MPAVILAAAAFVAVAIIFNHFYNRRETGFPGWERRPRKRRHWYDE